MNVPCRTVMAGLALGYALAWPVAACAQDESQSLGDLARNLRKNKAEKQGQAPQSPSPDHAVIDNDNLNQALEDAKTAKPVEVNKTVISIDPSGNALRVMSPDATCSLSFNARASALLVKPVLIENLPLDELVKLDGPGTIQQDTLQLELFNGTDWELREVTVGLTLERHPGESAEVAVQGRVVPAVQRGAAPTVERRSDVTLLYHLKTQTKAFSPATFHENIGITPGPEEDWRWSIVEAQGIRPAGASPAPASLSMPLNGGAEPPVPEVR